MLPHRVLSPRSTSPGKVATLEHRVGWIVFVFLFLAGFLSSCDLTGLCPCPPPPPTYIPVDYSPAWSLDGNAIAYYRSFPSSAGPSGIYLIQSDGANNHLLLESSVWTRDLRFSPDGTRLSMTIGLEIYILDLQDRTLHRLTNSRGNAEWGDWSPDGRFLVYSGPFIRPGRSDDGGLHIIEVATGADRRLYNNGAGVYGADPRWSPQGEPITFWASDNVANHDIVTIRTDGTEPRRLTTSNREFAEDPRWLYGGSHLLYHWSNHAQSRPAETRVMRADGSEQARWPVIIHYYDAISPDSRCVVTTATQPDTTTLLGLPVWVLFIRDIDDAAGTSLRQLTSYAPPRHPWQ